MRPDQQRRLLDALVLEHEDAHGRLVRAPAGARTQKQRRRRGTRRVLFIGMAIPGPVRSRPGRRGRPRRLDVEPPIHDPDDARLAPAGAGIQVVDGGVRATPARPAPPGAAGSSDGLLRGDGDTTPAREPARARIRAAARPRPGDGGGADSGLEDSSGGAPPPPRRRPRSRRRGARADPALGLDQGDARAHRREDRGCSSSAGPPRSIGTREEKRRVAAAAGVAAGRRRPPGARAASGAAARAAPRRGSRRSCSRTIAQSGLMRASSPARNSG